MLVLTTFDKFSNISRMVLCLDYLLILLTSTSLLIASMIMLDKISNKNNVKLRYSCIANFANFINKKQQ